MTVLKMRLWMSLHWKTVGLNRFKEADVAQEKTVLRESLNGWFSEYYCSINTSVKWF